MTANPERLALLERAIERATSSHDARAAAAAWRAVLDEFDVVSRARPDPEPASGESDYRRLWDLAARAMANLGGEGEPPLLTVADYDSDRFGPLLGVSDEGSATAAIRRGALAAPKSAALPERTSFTLGIAHDAERLGAVGEVAVGPDEFAAIRLACRGRVLTTTNTGSRVNVRLFLDPPVVEIRAATAAAIDTARERLQKAFARFMQTPGGRARALTAVVRFDAAVPTRQARTVLAQLRRLIDSGTICNPKRHCVALLVDPGRGADRVERTRAGIELGAGVGMEEVAVEGLCERFEPDELAELLRYAAAKKVRLRRREIIDPQTTARHVWTGLSVARNMGLELGKYGLAPLTFEEQAEVVARIQYWFPFWCAAPVYYVDNPLVTRADVFHGPRLAAGIRLWLDMVARHKVRVVLIDTVNKSEGRRLLKDTDQDARGYLTRGEILKLTAYARDRGVKVLWAGGITLPQAYTFGKLGVFGVYVTSDAATLQPLGRKARRDPFLVGLREPDQHKVARVKLALEAGFLVGRGAADLAADVEALLAAAIAGDSAKADALQTSLHPRMVRAWRAHLGSPTTGRPS
jgi:hypothetical protein